MISAPIAAWTVTGTSCCWAASRIDASAPGSLLRLAKAPGETLAHPLICPRRRGDGGVHLGSRLLGHPEAAVRQTSLHVLARPAKRGQLEVVDCSGTVHGDMGDDPVGQPSVDERAQSNLHNMATQQEDHSPAISPGSGDGIDYLAKIVGSQNVRKAAEEGGEGAVWSGR